MTTAANPTRYPMAIMANPRAEQDGGGGDHLLRAEPADHWSRQGHGDDGAASNGKEHQPQCRRLQAEVRSYLGDPGGPRGEGKARAHESYIGRPNRLTQSLLSGARRRNGLQGTKFYATNHVVNHQTSSSTNLTLGRAPSPPRSRPPGAVPVPRATWRISASSTHRPKTIPSCSARTPESKPALSPNERPGVSGFPVLSAGLGRPPAPARPWRAGPLNRAAPWPG